MLNFRGLRAPLLGGLGVPCRCCLGPLDGDANWGICSPCWGGLVRPAEDRCPQCVLVHPEEEACPGGGAWVAGDAFWDYRGGRPALGALLVPGIKAGENGWRRALLAKAARVDLPPWVEGTDFIVPAPTAPWKQWTRGRDLAMDWALHLGERTGIPVRAVLRKAWFHPPQAGRPESARRRMPRKAIRLADPRPVAEARILLVDDVWTTGTTLLRCAQALQAGGASELRVLTLFRAV
ncbi:MAG: ComF family protein [Acidobacteria bacterium]|nr:ComF family protein [Acidobacteriota bacterium]